MLAEALAAANGTECMAHCGALSACSRIAKLRPLGRDIIPVSSLRACVKDIVQATRQAWPVKSAAEWGPVPIAWDGDWGDAPIPAFGAASPAAVGKGGSSSLSELMLGVLLRRLIVLLSHRCWNDMTQRRSHPWTRVLRRASAERSGGVVFSARSSASLAIMSSSVRALSKAAEGMTFEVQEGAIIEV